MKQRMHEEQLRQKEQELQAREIDLLERELHFMIKQQTPTPIKRKGKFKRSRLKLLKKEPGSNISFPSDFRHTITVQHTLDHKAIAGVISPHSPPGSPAITRLRAIALPADGVKGKTWGPSTCHQRERGQITMLRPAPNRSAIWSKSAPNLDKTRNTVLSRPPHDIGNTSPIDSNKSSGLQMLINKMSALTTLSEFKRFGSTLRNNSFPTNNASLIPKPGLGQNERLSRSIGNITESNYDTVFSTESFVIARGVSNSVHFGEEYADVNDNHDDTQQLLR
jgi:mitogen-activated protein kinase kinase kinase 9